MIGTEFACVELAGLGVEWWVGMFLAIRTKKNEKKKKAHTTGNCGF